MDKDRAINPEGYQKQTKSSLNYLRKKAEQERLWLKLEIKAIKELNKEGTPPKKIIP